ncbi:spore wall protein 9 [Trichonephila clavata]|uniref:Spore wall protein 9 n=1 Tax=Trichonephila clavata TaxID=2740835 RepID=A0A8X6L9A2_TRICU|nr:spore wall protein 9 [Trichonephila clavata]
MILGRYKPLKATDLPSKDEVKVFIDKAQKEECLLISGNYPEHYPREPEYQWSLADGFFDGKDVEIWKNAAPDFVAILENLFKGKANYKFDGEKVGSELDKDIKQMCKKLGYENVSSDQIAKFFKDLGTINTTSHESNIYSRFFYLFVFLTINNNYDYIQESTGKSKKDTNENEVKMLELANIYAQIVSRVFPESYDYEDKDISVFKKLLTSST